MSSKMLGKMYWLLKLSSSRDKESCSTPKHIVKMLQEMWIARVKWWWEHPVVSCLPGSVWLQSLMVPATWLLPLRIISMCFSEFLQELKIGLVRDTKMCKAFRTAVAFQNWRKLLSKAKQTLNIQSQPRSLLAWLPWQRVFIVWFLVHLLRASSCFPSASGGYEREATQKAISIQRILFIIFVNILLKCLPLW